MTNLYRNYWAKAPSFEAGFQTVWVQRHTKQAQSREQARRAQYIKSNEITG